MNKEIDYPSKIANFKTMTENNDEDIAFKYLERNEWDEGRAANNYFDDMAKKINQTNSRGRIREEAKNQNTNDNSQSAGFINSFLNSFKDFFGMGRPFVDPGNIDFRSYNINSESNTINPQAQNQKIEFFNVLPSQSKNLDSFYHSIKTKIGILFIYNSKNLGNLKQIIEQLIYDQDLMFILEHQYTTYAISESSNEAKSLRNIAKGSILFIFNPFNLDKNDPNIIMEKIIENVKFDQFSALIYKCLSTKDTNGTNIMPNISNDLYSGINDKNPYEEDFTHGSIIDKQKEEMRMLEELEEENKRQKRREEELRKQKINDERLLKEKLMEEERRRVNMVINKRKELPVEPLANDPNSTHILFRHPDGINRSERRFFITDKIKDLYNYVESLDDTTFNKEGKFDLIQTFPFVIFKDKEKTLADEKLVPNAVIQIREID